jgi:protein gp37
MASDIEWTDEVWNPIVGCNHVSPGCEHCYAARMAHRGMTPNHRGLTVVTKHGPRWNGQVRCLSEILDRPLKLRKPRTVFVNSMSDLFHEKVPFEFIASVFGVMAATPHHQYVVLTKRDPRKWFEWINKKTTRGNKPDFTVQCEALGVLKDKFPLHGIKGTVKCQPWPLPNVALGCSCENQEQADRRIPWLLQTPAACRFISVEPMLGPIDFTHMDAESSGSKEYCVINALTGRQTDMGRPCPDVPKVDAIICGCESGPRARPMDEDWARSLRDQCVESGTNFFYKQAKRDGKLVSMPELDGRVWNQLPWRRDA